jgi:hypothetical protein
MSCQRNFTFRQKDLAPQAACAALAAYWLELMKEGDAVHIRERKLRDHAQGSANKKQHAYESACYSTNSLDQGALRTAYTPLASTGMQVRAPVRHDAFDETAMANLVGYITKNHLSGVLFTFSYSSLFSQQTHTVAFWKDGRTTYLFDADRGEFESQSVGELVVLQVFEMYRKNRGASFGTCHYLHYRCPHPT